MAGAGLAAATPATDTAKTMARATRMECTCHCSFLLDHTVAECRVPGKSHHGDRQGTARQEVRRFRITLRRVFAPFLAEALAFRLSGLRCLPRPP